MADRVGQQLGNYRLVRLLGQGGFADVYLGQHLHLDSQAAIKVMHTHLAQEEWESFRKEARIIAGLMHPHIVRLLDFDVEEGTPFLVMNYAPNGTLRRRHPPGQPLVPQIILPYVLQVADALRYVHERKLIHRDIKPENMLLGPENEVLLSDFGVAIIAQSSRQQSSQNIGGTVAYMAPEQIQSKPCQASDQYALGVVVYEWLTGERPFDGSFTEIATKHILTMPQRLRSLVPALSPAVEDVVLRALAKDPQERFPGVQAFAQALEEAVGADQAATLIAPRPALSSERSEPQARVAAPGEAKRQPPKALVVSVSATTSEAPAEESLSTQALISSPRLSLPGGAVPTEPIAPARRGISRRAVVLGLAGLAASGGALTWLALNHQSPASTRAARPTATPRRTATASPPPLPAPGKPLLTFRRHTLEVYDVAWSPDGTKIASASLDKTVWVWDARTGAVAFTFTRHTAGVNAVAWSPDGTMIASGSSDMTVHIWNATDGTVLQTYSGHTSHVVSLAWSPDGTKIASGSGYRPLDPNANRDHTVHVWDVQTARLLFPPYTGHTAQIKQVAWSHEATRIASASVDTTVQVWSAGDGSRLYTYRGHSDEVWAVDWSPNDKRLVSGSHDGTVQVWEPKAGGVEIIYSGHSDEVDTVAWSPDGRHIASGSGYTLHRLRQSYDTTVQVWNPDSGPDVNPLIYRGHTDVVEAVAWSHDSKRIASASDDKTVQVWEAP